MTTSYDALNRPTALLENGSVSLAGYAYDDLSRRTTVTLGNGTTTTYGYDAQGSLASLTHNLAGTAQDITWSYTRNQIQDLKTQSWSNDSYAWTGYSNGTRNYTANGLNQYATAQGATLSYDANGNLTGDGVWTYTYNLDNQLTAANQTGASQTGASHSLAYDGAGRLRQTTLAGTVTNLTYDGVDLVAEYDSAGTLLRRYVHGPGVDQPLVGYEGSGTANKSWLYADHQGSLVATANSAGTGTALYRYGPYGEPDQTTGLRFRYTGQQLLGPLNLYYYKARFYSPALGRFLQTDPVGYRDGLNRYAYVGNNPLNRNDPSGLLAADMAMLSGKLGEYMDGANLSSFNPSFVNATVGFGDGVSSATTFGMYSTADVRNSLEIDGGVDQSSASYTGGKYTGYAWSAGTVWAGGLNGGANSVFWSGSGNMEGAVKLGTTLESTPIGALMNSAGEKVPYVMWKAASATFAANAQGIAIKVGVESGNIWRTIEQPILNLRNIVINYVP